MTTTCSQKSSNSTFKVLTADATVVGLVEMPDHSPPPFTVTVGLHTDEGIGVKQDVDAAGRFTFTVPHHVYKVDVRVLNPGYAAPPVDSIYAAPLTTTVVPTITLVARDAVITGTLTVTGTNAPAQDVPVIAWSPDTHAAFSGRSGPDGMYMVMVYSGTWLGAASAAAGSTVPVHWQAEPGHSGRQPGRAQRGLFPALCRCHDPRRAG